MIDGSFRWISIIARTYALIMTNYTEELLYAYGYPLGDEFIMAYSQNMEKTICKYISFTKI